MEVVEEIYEEKLSPENETWEETKEDIYTRLQKNFGASIHCEVNDQNDSFCMTVSEEKCILSDETLQACLPSSSYSSLLLMNEQSLSPEVSKQYIEWEAIIRKAFQENEEVILPPEILQSILRQTEKVTPENSQNKRRQMD
jgi:hypothetical protein